MTEALRKALEAKGTCAGDGPYALDVELVKYAPGNAFAPWLPPGAGATVLNVVARITGADGQTVAEIPVERSSAAGGGYTIRAYKYVFEDVANEIAAYLTDTSKRRGK
jgi:hypothetical protein